MRLANGEGKKEKNQREAHMIVGMKGENMAASGVRPGSGLNPSSYHCWLCHMASLCFNPHNSKIQVTTVTTT